ncbi:MAG: hypothetical protein F4Y37_09920 [Caldilineaceae bacterium SB0664_bin_22]|nr:hypothetical protein [Caldilineaceae bacterium SB0664_bin_22]MYC63894.1 hypothetical protein [Caldilineaceae bacterium SB0661_bin_34]
MNGSFSPVLVGQLASSQISGQQVQEGLCPLWRLQAAGQPRPGLEAATGECRAGHGDNWVVLPGPELTGRMLKLGLGAIADLAAVLLTPVVWLALWLLLPWMMAGSYVGAILSLMVFFPLVALF